MGLSAFLEDCILLGEINNYVEIVSDYNYLNSIIMTDRK